jgi:hypothetical protein
VRGVNATATTATAAAAATATTTVTTAACSSSSTASVKHHVVQALELFLQMPIVLLKLEVLAHDVLQG